MSGYTIIENDSMEKARSMANACLFIDTGNSPVVLDMMQMSVQIEQLIVVAKKYDPAQ